MPSYSVDPLHATAIYKIKEPGMSWAYGTAIESVGTGKYNVTGKLTMWAVSKTINFILSKTGETDSARNDHRMGYEGYPVFKRSDFGMKSGENHWDDEMMLIISLQAVRTG